MVAIGDPERRGENLFKGAESVVEQPGDVLRDWDFFRSTIVFPTNSFQER